MLSEIYPRIIKAITGDGSTRLTIKPSRMKRLHWMQLMLTYAGGTNTLAALMAAITEIRVLAGAKKILWKLSGTQLRDWCLLHGTTYDFDGLPNTGCQVTLPFSPEWFQDAVQNMLALNPTLLGADIYVEVDSAIALTCTAIEGISDDLDAKSVGYISLEAPISNAGGVKFFTGTEIKAVGRLLSASIYPDSTNSREITPAALLLGEDDFIGHDALSSAQNDEQLGRKGLTPAASGRTANIYDIVPVKADMIFRGYDLATWGKARLQIEAAAAMGGTVTTVIARIE